MIKGAKASYKFLLWVNKFLFIVYILTCLEVNRFTVRGSNTPIFTFNVKVSHSLTAIGAVGARGPLNLGHSR